MTKENRQRERITRLLKQGEISLDCLGINSQDTKIFTVVFDGDDGSGKSEAIARCYQRLITLKGLNDPLLADTNIRSIEEKDLDPYASLRDEQRKEMILGSPLTTMSKFHLKLAGRSESLNRLLKEQRTERFNIDLIERGVITNIVEYIDLIRRINLDFYKERSHSIYNELTDAIAAIRGTYRLPDLTFILLTESGIATQRIADRYVQDKIRPHIDEDPDKLAAREKIYRDITRFIRNADKQIVETSHKPLSELVECYELGILQSYTSWKQTRLTQT